MEICSIMSSYLLPADKDGNGKVECFQWWRQISEKFSVAFKPVCICKCLYLEGGTSFSVIGDIIDTKSDENSHVFCSSVSNMT